MKVLYTLLLFIWASASFSQNLVVNPSFEEKSYCPTNFNQQQLKVITGWSQLNEGTPDYFHRCSDKVGVPNNMFGSQLPKDGDAYAGMAVYSPTQRNYREYLTSKLSRALSAGEMVCIEFYVSAADFSKYVIDGMGVALTKDRLTQERSLVVKHRPQLSNPHFYMLDDADGWVLISDVYTAQGGEQYITIGNFAIDKELKILSRTRESGAQENSSWAYVFVDQVSVKPVKKRTECSCENDLLKSLAVDPPLELKEYDHIQLDAVLFDFDEDVLTDTAQTQLDEVYNLLRRNKAMYLEIDGHTDAVGNDQYNEGLSKRRAERVISFLADKGIDRSRLTLKFYGSTQPKADNTSIEGRAKNRRVEFEILQKKFELVQ
ncbi:MAG: OmpA family protein [Flavobacteriales bacterium]